MKKSRIKGGQNTKKAQMTDEEYSEHILTLLDEWERQPKRPSGLPFPHEPSAQAKNPRE